jgi:hypothetical protein
VIDEDVRLSKPLDGRDLGLEGPVRSGWFQWVTGEDEEHVIVSVNNLWNVVMKCKSDRCRE